MRDLPLEARTLDRVLRNFVRCSAPQLLAGLCHPGLLAWRKHPLAFPGVKSYCPTSACEGVLSLGQVQACLVHRLPPLVLLLCGALQGALATIGL